MFRKYSNSTSKPSGLLRVSSTLTSLFNHQTNPTKLNISSSDETLTSTENSPTFSSTISSNKYSSATAFQSGLGMSASNLVSATKIVLLAPITLDATERNRETILGSRVPETSKSTEMPATCGNSSSMRSWRRILTKSKVKRLDTCAQQQPSDNSVPSCSFEPHQKVEKPISAEIEATGTGFTSEQTALRMAYESLLINYCSQNPDCQISTFFDPSQTTSSPAPGEVAFRPPFMKKVSHAFLRTSSSDIKEHGFTKTINRDVSGTFVRRQPMVTRMLITPSEAVRFVDKRVLRKVMDALTLEILYFSGSFSPAVYKRLVQAMSEHGLRDQTIVRNLMDSTQGSQAILKERRTKRKRQNHQKPPRKNNDPKRPQKIKIHNTMF